MVQENLLSSKWAQFCARLERDSLGTVVSQDMPPGSGGFAWAQQLTRALVRPLQLSPGSSVRRAIYLKPVHGRGPRKSKGRGPNCTIKSEQECSMFEHVRAAPFARKPANDLIECALRHLGGGSGSKGNVVSDAVEHSQCVSSPPLSQYLSCESLEWLFDATVASVRVYYCLEEWDRGSRARADLQTADDPSFRISDRLASVYCASTNSDVLLVGPQTAEKWLRSHRSIDSQLRFVPEVILGGGSSGLHFAPAMVSHLILAASPLMKNGLEGHFAAPWSACAQIDMPLGLFVAFSANRCATLEPLSDMCLRHLSSRTLHLDCLDLLNDRELPSAVDVLPGALSDSDRLLALVQNPTPPPELELDGSRCAILLEIAPGPQPTGSGRRLSAMKSWGSRKNSALFGGLCQWQACIEKTSPSMKLCALHCELKIFLERKGGKGEASKYLPSRQMQVPLPTFHHASADLELIIATSRILSAIVAREGSSANLFQRSCLDMLRLETKISPSLPRWVSWRDSRRMLSDFSTIDQELSASALVMEAEKGTTRELQLLCDAGIYPAEELDMIRHEHQSLEVEWSALQDQKSSGQAFEKEMNLELDYCKKKLTLLQRRRQKQGQQETGDNSANNKQPQRISRQTESTHLRSSGSGKTGASFRLSRVNRISRIYS
jgi:hypothetical protein